MNWEAFFAIGSVTLILAAILAVPGYFLARWLKRHPAVQSAERRTITAAGGVVFGLMVVVLTGGMAVRELAPTTTIGRFLSSSRGLLTFGLFVILLFGAMGSALARRGIRLEKLQGDV